ncbi:hypothetical protein FBU30_001608 [Linnemannia zychae]|nr:hypothetical protein FBU30_001608 [Linnemannia zychae]
MLFPRWSNKNTADISPDADGHYPIEALLGTSSHRNSTSSDYISSSYSFGEGYSVIDNSSARGSHDHRSAKVRRHHSTGTLLDASAQQPLNNSIQRNNTVPQARRTSRPQRLTIDHAAFIATYPSLDGLGDVGYRSNSTIEYYRNFKNTANTASTSRSSKAGSSKLRKQQSQETLPSRASTSSIASMVSDASSSSTASTSASSVREPLTPTKPSNYRSMDCVDVNADATTMKKSKKASQPVTGDLMDIAAEEQTDNVVKSLTVCLSPQSDNFFSTEEGFAGTAANTDENGDNKARGQRRQLIAH